MKPNLEIVKVLVVEVEVEGVVVVDLVEVEEVVDLVAGVVEEEEVDLVEGIVAVEVVEEEEVVVVDSINQALLLKVYFLFLFNKRVLSLPIEYFLDTVFQLKGLHIVKIFVLKI